MMLVKGTNDPVRVASADFTVIDGVLSNRNPQSNQTCGGGVCPIQVSEVLFTTKHIITLLHNPSHIFFAGFPPDEVLFGNRRWNSV